MKRELPLELNIPYSGMLRDRNRLIAIMANHSNMAWYTENFLPLLLYPNGNIHCYDTTNFYEIFNLYDQVIDIKSIRQISIEAIKNELDTGNYIIALVDGFFISGSVFNKTNHGHLEILVYGYDEQEECFLFHGSQIEKQDYGCGKCCYDDFIKALMSSLEKISEIESNTWRVLFGHPLSSFKVKSWNKSINVKKTYYHFNNLLTGKKILIFGMDGEELFFSGSMIYEGIIENLELIKNGKIEDYERAIWCIKLLSGYFISYKNVLSMLRKQGVTDIGYEIDEIIEIISKDLMSGYALLQKYYITGKTRNIDRAIEIFSRVKCNSMTVWKTVCVSLENYLL